MDWERKKKDRILKEAAQRANYLSMSDFEAEQMPASERYQRMRYQREVYAAKFIEEQSRHVQPIKHQDSTIRSRAAAANIVQFRAAYERKND